MQSTFSSRLLHVVVVIMIAIYVVFAEKSESTVESVSRSVKTAHASTYQKGPFK